MHWKNRDKNHPPADWEPTVNWQASTTPAVAINTTQAAASEIDQASKPSIMNHLKLIIINTQLIMYNERSDGE